LRWGCWSAVVLVVVILGAASAADYVFESSVIKGVGYSSHEVFGQTAPGLAGQKFAERISGTGSFYDITRYEQDAHRGFINYTKEAEFEYFPVTYESRSYDRKWTDKMCIKNYDAGAVFTEAYTNAEHIQRNTEVVTVGNGARKFVEVHLNSNVIGKALLGWSSKGTTPDSKGRYFEIGMSREEMTGVFSIEKYVKLSSNSSNETHVDWLPCT
jgi:hypothetical protein